MPPVTPAPRDRTAVHADPHPATGRTGRRACPGRRPGGSPDRPAPAAHRRARPRRPASRLALSLLAVPLLLTALACGLGGPVQDPAPIEPVKPREYVQDVYVDIDPFWKSMDLPWYGAVSKEPCTERSLTVSYLFRRQGVTPEQLRTWWPEALVAEGDRKSVV